MQTRARRTNQERTEATRGELISAARQLFTERGYADTGTPDIVAAARVTRGALYHHFPDKKALLRAVIEQEAKEVADEIERAAPESLATREALLSGADAYLEAMAVAGRTRLLLLDGPAVLGHAEMAAIDKEHAERTLREGLAAAIREGDIVKVPLDALTGLLSAAFDRAALAIDAGGSARTYRTAIRAIIEGLLVRR
ncbi:TetR family transcriptional regulator [Pendulispora rubella]|uniref:TetR family transcriptional regulator n=1 Tax=Pendulispora rubella TaxID=2741070 RepID=A0ABZ2KV99_9BACT